MPKSSPLPTHVRYAQPGDIAALLVLEETCFEVDRISRRSFRDLLARETAVTFVYERDGALLGYAMLLFRRGTAMSRLYSFAVHPDASGKGIGRLLLQTAEDITFKRGRLLLRLEVREDNERAIELYRRNGYRPIGRYLDYYADHTTALRFEKTIRGDVPLNAPTPYYEQTTDFTCGSCCLMMALARWRDDFKLDPVAEIRLWREATTIFMMSGLGGCEPHGLAVAAAEAGLSAEILVTEKGPLFLNSVRTEEKRKVMELAQADFTSRARALGLKVRYGAFGLGEIRKAIAAGKVVIVLLSGYHMFGKRVPHWVLAHGDDGHHILIHDPWVEDEIGETIADAANLPVAHEQFDRMARWGRSGLRAAVILGPKAA
ncbi:MAG: GNAT family N-acetyltransferase/peptidase C39 family protein [Nitratireductor sp.]|nr:GNAT family N-acetyltransferase/peptidase C39 family protein [Nitratireductor sp.]